MYLVRPHFPLSLADHLTNADTFSPDSLQGHDHRLDGNGSSSTSSGREEVPRGVQHLRQGSQVSTLLGSE